MNELRLPKSQDPPHETMLASCYFERIEKQINEIHKNLKDDEQILVTVPLHNTTTIIAEWFGYYNPNMIIVEGIDAVQNRTRLLIPHNQIQVSITVIKRKKDEPKRTIGFQTPDTNRRQQET